MNHIDDLLVGVGIIAVASGVYLWLGLAAMLILVGVLLIAIGLLWAVRNDRQLDRPTNG